MKQRKDAGMPIDKAQIRKGVFLQGAAHPAAIDRQANAELHRAAIEEIARRLMRVREGLDRVKHERTSPR